MSFDDSAIDDDAPEANKQKEQEGDKIDIPDDSSEEDKGWEYSLGEETGNYIDPDDEGAETETPTPSSPCRTRSQSKSGTYGILVWNVY